MSDPQPQPTRRWNIPVWPGVVLVLAVELWAQHLPIIGFLMMLMLAPFWSVVLVHMLLVTIVLDVWRRAAPRWLLVVPVLVYGGNLIACGASIAAYLSLRHEITQANADQSVAFDPTGMALVVAEPFERSEAVERFALPVSYSPLPGRVGEYMAYRVLPRSLCNSIPRTRDATRVDWSIFWIRDVVVANGCVFQNPEALPDGPVWRVSQATTRIDDPVLTGELFNVVLSPENGRPLTLSQGRAEILPPIPLVASGCYLGNDKSSWECSTTLLRFPAWLGDKNVDGLDLLGQALGLSLRKTTRVEGRYRKPQLVLDDQQTVALARQSAPALIAARLEARK